MLITLQSRSQLWGDNVFQNRKTKSKQKILTSADWSTVDSCSSVAWTKSCSMKKFLEKPKPYTHISITVRTCTFVYVHFFNFWSQVTRSSGKILSCWPGTALKSSLCCDIQKSLTIETLAAYASGEKKIKNTQNVDRIKITHPHPTKGRLLLGCHP